MGSTRKGKASRDVEIEEIVSDLTEDQMREFLTTLAREDIRMRQRIISQFGVVDIERFTGSLDIDIDCILDDCGDWDNGFISYYHASDFEDKMVEAFHDAVDPLVRRGALEEAFEMSYAFMVRLEEVGIDDSCGTIETLIDLCVGQWDEIVRATRRSTGGKQVRETICETLCEFVKQGPAQEDSDTYEDLCDAAVGFLVRTFAREAKHARTLLELFDDRLKAASAPTDKPWEWPYCSRAQFAMRRLEVMAAQGETVASRLEFAKPYLGDEEIVIPLVEEAKGRGDLDGAIALLEEARSRCIKGEEARGAKKPPEPKDAGPFAAELADLYEAAGRLDLAREELYTLATESHPDYGSGDTDRWFKQLKALTPAEEWPALRDKMLAVMTNKYRLRTYLSLEGMYDELIKSIEGESVEEHWNSWSDKRLSEARRFRRQLFEVFPERMTAIYADGADGLVAHGGNRKAYQQVASLLTEMVEAGLGEAATKLAKSIREENPRRPALLDELRKAGW